MSDNLSKGPIQVISNDPIEINDALRQIVDRLDELAGLRGRAMIYDRVRVDDPQVDQDALTLGAAGLSSFVTLTGAQTISGDKTFSGDNTFTGAVAFDGSTITITNGSGYIEITNSTFKYVDGNGTLIHAFGTITV